MSRVGHFFLQLGGVIVQVGVAASGVIPPPYNFIVAGGVAAIQGVAALIAHKGK